MAELLEPPETRSAEPPIEELSAAELRHVRSRATLSQAELARRLGVRSAVVCNWEKGKRPIPPGRVAQVRRVLAEAATTERPDPLAAAVGQVVAMVEDRPGLTQTMVFQRRQHPTTRPALKRALADRLIHEQEVPYQDAAGKTRNRRELHPGPSPTITATSPPGTLGLSAAELQAARTAAALSQTELAHRLAVSRQLVGHWEEGRRPISASHAARIRSALVVPDALADLRAARLAAGLEQAELARRLRVPPGNLSKWETGKRAIPPGRIAELRRVLADAATEPPGKPAAEIMPRVLAAIAARPGITRKQLVKTIGHGRRRHPGQAKAVLAALDRALAEGYVHQRPTIHKSAAGRFRTVQGLHPGSAHRAQPAAATLTPTDLRRVRAQAGLSQAELARRLGGVGAGAIGKWERGERIMPSPWAEAIRELLTSIEPAGPPPDPVDMRLIALVDAIKAEPGLSRHDLARRLRCGNSSPTLAAALARALAGGLVHKRPVPYRVGHGGYRTRTGFYPGPTPSSATLPSEPAMTAAELRAARLAVGLHQAELAHAVGVTQAAVSGWERARSRVAPDRVSAVRQALAEAATAGRPDPVASAVPDVVAAIEREPGLTRTRLLLRRPRQTTRAALARALDDGLVHERQVPYQDAAGKTRTRLELHPGPASAGLAAPGFSTAELRAGRLAAGLTLRELAARLGVSVSLVSAWEHDLPIPAGRVPLVRAALEDSAP